AMFRGGCLRGGCRRLRGLPLLFSGVGRRLRVLARARFDVALRGLLANELVVIQSRGLSVGEGLRLCLPQRADASEHDRVRRAIEADGPELRRRPLTKLEAALTHTSSEPSVGAPLKSRRVCGAAARQSERETARVTKVFFLGSSGRHRRCNR